MDEDKQVSENVSKFFRVVMGTHIALSLSLVAYVTYEGGFHALAAWFLILLPLTIAVTAEVEKSAKKDMEQKAG